MVLRLIFLFSYLGITMAVTNEVRSFPFLRGVFWGHAPCRLWEWLDEAFSVVIGHMGFQGISLTFLKHLFSWQTDPLELTSGLFQNHYDLRVTLKLSYMTKYTIPRLVFLFLLCMAITKVIKAIVTIKSDFIEQFLYKQKHFLLIKTLTEQTTQ